MKKHKHTFQKLTNEKRKRIVQLLCRTYICLMVDNITAISFYKTVIQTEIYSFIPVLQAWETQNA